MIRYVLMNWARAHVVWLKQGLGLGAGINIKSQISSDDSERAESTGVPYAEEAD